MKGHAQRAARAGYSAMGRRGRHASNTDSINNACSTHNAHGAQRAGYAHGAGNAHSAQTPSGPRPLINLSHPMTRLPLPHASAATQTLPRWALAAALLVAATCAQAGRPLGTDDAGTADAQTCQVEAWAERSRGVADGSWVVAPACGVAAGLELGGDHTTYQAGQGLHRAASLGLKWVPAAWAVDTPLGALALGLKAAVGYEKPTGAGWRRSGASLLGLATLKLAEPLALHANLGPQRQADDGSTTTQLRLALAWTPHPAALLFAETQANDRPAANGGAFNTLGGRWWLLADRLGLDLTASREAGAGSGTRWSLGLGWYGIGR